MAGLRPRAPAPVAPPPVSGRFERTARRGRPRTTARAAGESALRREVEVFPDLEGASAAVAASIVALADDPSPRVSIAISGGRTPEGLFARLAEMHRTAPALARIDVFFADERAVGPRSADSNFALAERTWFGPGGVPPDRIHRVHGELPAGVAAEQYDADLRRYFGGAPAPGVRGFDLVLLGVGPDGHTASLFPGAADAAPAGRWAVATPPAPRPPRVPRITLTLAALATAREVVFLVGGAEKRAVVRQLLAPVPEGTPVLPAAQVEARERVRWMIAADAAPAPTAPE